MSGDAPHVRWRLRSALHVVLATALTACAGIGEVAGPDRVGTRAALVSAEPAVEAIDGVAAATLSMDEELGASIPTALRVRLDMSTTDLSVVGPAMREAARLVWTSDVPDVGFIRVSAATPDGVLHSRVDGAWDGLASADDLAALFGPRPAG